ncbi:DUF317 domain-containing protein [Streptomyces sp. TRM76323]|uniref:DUF317 domain-containing protein n=1 Tax=Streptomyces tamarix TaxID=3078565 RepID=A0ABU3QR93_9ACTN|nr:DUF317 domain-containing protein [Streptomyces tamarix]MDT9685033.1 DUF317 domain-containing protein [Streptomyces tamarix]
MSRRQQRWTGWGQAQQHYLIEPRHLAGGGDLRHVTEYLRASGWKDTTRRTGAVFAFDSPDQLVRVAYRPPGGWQIRGAAQGHQPAWQVTLTPQTPVEIVAGVTDALTKPRSAHAPDVWAPLATHRWNTEPGQPYTATSPNRDAFVQYVTGEHDQQHWWVGARNEFGPVWNAQATASTPLHLMQALTTALADPEPVMRPRGHVPLSNRIRTTSVSVLPDQLTAWQRARITAARTAAWGRTWTSSRSRTAPAAPRYARTR